MSDLSELEVIDRLQTSLREAIQAAETLAVSSGSQASSATCSVVVTAAIQAPQPSNPPAVPASVVGTSRIIDGIEVLKEDNPGDFLVLDQGSGRYGLNASNILNNFYSNHADSYDFLVVVPNRPLSSHYSVVANQAGEVLGNPPGALNPAVTKNLKSLVAYDTSGLTGSLAAGLTLQDYEAQNMRFQLVDLAHEMAHHWLAYIPWEGMTIPHYSYMADLFSGSTSYSDPMEYYHWVDTGTEKACVDNNSSAVIQKFSNLSLYLMGLVPKASVQPIPVIHYQHDASISGPFNTYGPQCGQAAVFLDTKTYTIDDLLALAGKDRTPAYPNAQKNFKVAYVVVASAGSDAPPSLTVFISDVIAQFPHYWSGLTNGLSQII